MTALELDLLEAEIRQVYFFDTPELTLHKSGVVVRARRVQLRGDDTVVEVHSVVPTELPSGPLESPNHTVRIHAVPDGYLCSESVTGTLGTTEVKETVMGKRPVQKLFSKDQQTFFAANAPHGIELRHLEILGPITVFKLRFKPEGYRRRVVVVADLWQYPDYSLILEFSAKCPAADAFQAVSDMKAFARQRGLEISGDQPTVTRQALEFFAHRLPQA
jgi:hypothetical protein